MKRYNNAYRKNNPQKFVRVTIVLNRCILMLTQMVLTSVKLSAELDRKKYFKIEEMVKFYKYLYAGAPPPAPPKDIKNKSQPIK